MEIIIFMIMMFLYLQLYQQTATIHKNVKHNMTFEDFHVIVLKCNWLL